MKTADILTFLAFRLTNKYGDHDPGGMIRAAHQRAADLAHEPEVYGTISGSADYMDATGPSWGQRKNCEEKPHVAAALLIEARNKFAFYQSQHEAKARAIETEIADCDEGSEQDVRLHERLHDAATKAKVNREQVAKIDAFLSH